MISSVGRINHFVYLIVIYVLIYFLNHKAPMDA